MIHSESTTFSPSSFNFTRSTPCVEGCCGPMLMMISSAPRTVVSTFCSMLASEFRSVLRNPELRKSVMLIARSQYQVFADPGGILGQDVVILAQRKSLPPIRQQDARQIGVTLKYDSKHVISFALQPIRRGPNVRNGRHWFAVRSPNFQTQPLVFGEGIEIQHHIESFLSLRPVHRGQIRQKIELFVIASETRDFDKMGAIHYQDRLLAVLPCFQYSRSKSLLKSLHQGIFQRLRLRRRFFRRYGWFGWRGSTDRSARLCCGGRSARYWCGSRRFRWRRRGNRLCRWRLLGGSNGRSRGLVCLFVGRLFALRVYWWLLVLRIVGHFPAVTTDCRRRRLLTSHTTPET